MAIDFFALAPTTLRNYRQRRYGGGEMCLPMTAFNALDQQRIRTLYDFIRALYGVFDSAGNCTADTVRRLAEVAPSETVRAVFAQTRELGHVSPADESNELFAKTVHDIRSGGLTPLLARLQLVNRQGWKIEDARAIFFLTRDHLKIMRNALVGLDDVQRVRDQEVKLHGASLIEEKWQNASLISGDRRVRLEIDSHFIGYISESCIEFGALDRVLYNLINNACRHTIDDAIKLQIRDLPMPDPSERRENTRFVLTNRVSEADRAALAAQDLRKLFSPGFSTTESGLGLTVVSDFVANAYGLLSRTAALDGGYLGARLDGDCFVVWFHWPIAHQA